MQKTILIVDDEPSVLKLVEVILAGAGYSVLAAGNYKTALALCGAHEKISLALLDYVMPDMNGAEVAERLRQIRSTLPIAMMSGFAPQEIRDRNVPLQSFPLIQKPFKPSVLLEFVKRALDSEAPC